MNKKLFLAGLFCLVSFALQAQKDDLGLWTSVGMEKRLFRDFDISLEGEFRSRDKLSEVGRWSGSAGMAYKITNWLKAATAYTYIYYNHPLENITIAPVSLYQSLMVTMVVLKTMNT